MSNLAKTISAKLYGTIVHVENSENVVAGVIFDQCTCIRWKLSSWEGEMIRIQRAAHIARAHVKCLKPHVRIARDAASLVMRTDRQPWNALGSSHSLPP